MTNKKYPIDQLLSDVHNYSVNLESRDIYLHSYHKGEDDEPGVDWRMSTTFIKNLHILQQKDLPILIHLHCTGGCWPNGMAVFNAITFSVSPVTMLAYSQASSMSGVILQAAYPRRIMMPDCYFMMHMGSIGLEDHSLAAKEAIAYNERSTKRMLQIFAENAINSPYFSSKKSSTKKTVALFFDKKMRELGDWYLDAEEAIYYGLADGILGSDEHPTVESLRQ